MACSQWAAPIEQQLFEVCVLLGQLGDTTAAVQILEEVLDRYGNHQDPDIQPIITGTRIELDYLTG